MCKGWKESTIILAGTENQTQPRAPPAPPLHNPLLGPTRPLPKGTPRATPSTATSALEDRRECGLCDELIHADRTTYTEAGKPETACF